MYTIDYMTKPSQAGAREVSPLVSTRLTVKEMEQIQDIVESGMYMSISDFVRGAIREKLGTIKVIQINDVDFKTAKEEILNYLKEKSGEEVYPSDMAEDLGLDLSLVFEVVEKLKEEGRLEDG